MKYQYLSDCHVHSDCSRDGCDPVMMMCETAARLGIYALTLTDHCECNAYYKESYDRSIRQSYFEARKAAAAFHGKVKIFAGVEIGQPMQNIAAAEDVLSSCEFDFALASVHNVKGMPDFYELNYDKEDVDEALTLYFDEMMEMIAWGGFDSLAHLTYPWRYIVGEHGYPLDTEKYMGRITEALKALIAGGKALELNTSGLRQKLGETMPNARILRLYKELGGELVTIGSDAHRWGDLCGGIEQGLDLLKREGFRHFAIYSRHEPKLYPIE